MSGTPGSTRPLVDVRLEALSTRGGRPPGVHEVGVHVRYGEFFTFLGPPRGVDGGRQCDDRFRPGVASRAGICDDRHTDDRSTEGFRVRPR